MSDHNDLRDLRHLAFQLRAERRAGVWHLPYFHGPGEPDEMLPLPEWVERRRKAAITIALSGASLGVLPDAQINRASGEPPATDEDERLAKFCDEKALTAEARVAQTGPGDKSFGAHKREAQSYKNIARRLRAGQQEGPKEGQYAILRADAPLPAALVIVEALAQHAASVSLVRTHPPRYAIRCSCGKWTGPETDHEPSDKSRREYNWHIAEIVAALPSAGSGEGPTAPEPHQDQGKARLVETLLAAHGAVDTLLAMLILKDRDFRPSKSAVWPTMLQMTEVLREFGAMPPDQVAPAPAESDSRGPS